MNKLLDSPGIRHLNSLHALWLLLQHLLQRMRHLSGYGKVKMIMVCFWVVYSCLQKPWQWCVMCKLVRKLKKHATLAHCYLRYMTLLETIVQMKTSIFNNDISDDDHQDQLDLGPANSAGRTAASANSDVIPNDNSAHPLAASKPAPTITKKRGQPSKKAQAVASKESGWFGLLSICIDITVYVPQNCHYQSLSISCTISQSSQKQKWRKARSSTSPATHFSRRSLTVNGILSRHSYWRRFLRFFNPSSLISTTTPFHGVFHIINPHKCNSRLMTTTNFLSHMLWSQRNPWWTSRLRQRLPRYVYSILFPTYIHDMVA